MEKLSCDDWQILFETDEEFYRKGHFERIFPIKNKEKMNYYLNFFDYPRYINIVVNKWINSKENFLENILKKKYNTSV